MTQTDDWMEIGTIVAPHGLYGEVRVYPNSDFPERFVEAGTRWLRRSETEEPQPVELLDGRYLPGKGLYVVQLEGSDNREDAERLRGGALVVPTSDRLPLEEGEYHVLDLIGLEVFDRQRDRPIGIVTDILPSGNDLLQVELNEEIRAEREAASRAIAAIQRQGRKGKRDRKPKKVPTTVLVPFVEEIVPLVDLDAKRIEIQPPPGLIEGGEVGSA
jgi:16S rRNA processing protein RimM